MILGESLAGCCGDFFESAGEQSVAHFAVVVFPSELHRELWGGASVGGVHELDVLQVLFGSAIDDRGDAVGSVVVRGESELAEGSEEVIVARFLARAGVAHRPRVDDLVIENLVTIGAADRGLGSVVLTGIAGWGYESRCGAVNAEVVRRGEVYEVLGVDRSREVVVEISALGHVVEEGEEQRWLIADRVEIAGGSLLRSLREGECREDYEDKCIPSDVAHSKIASLKPGNAL